MSQTDFWKYMHGKRPLSFTGSFVASMAAMVAGWETISLAFIILFVAITLIEYVSITGSVFYYVLERNGLDTEFDEIDPEKKSLYEILETLEK